MNLTSALAIYFVLWWLSFLIVLPIGNRSQADVGERLQGTDPGAPPRLRLLPKLVAASVMALVLTLAADWLLGQPGLREYWK